jgi:serine/threonine protein kinase
MTGKVIGTYQIIQQLGQGLHGTTYQAVEQGRGQEAALKAIEPALAQHVIFKQNLRTLATILTQIRHPHLATFHTILQMGSELYVISEFVNGTPMNEALQRSGVLACEEAVRLAAQMLDALSYAYATGVWHGGIKPSNLILTTDRQIKLTDLGLAQAAESASWTGRLDASVLNYAAPEQLRGEACDARTDVYAMGAVLYEMLTGLPPFRRANEAALRHAQLEEPPPSPRNYFPLIPLPLEQAVLRALAKSPAARFSSTAEFRQVLLSWANEAKVSDNTAAAEMNSPAAQASTSPPLSSVAIAFPQTPTPDRFATKPQPPLTPNNWPQLTPQPSTGKAAAASSIVSTGLNDEVVVNLEEQAAGKRSFWRPIAAVTGVATLLGVTYAVVRVNNGATPTLTSNQSIIQVSPTLSLPSATPTIADALSETAAAPSPTELPKLKEPATSPTVLLKRPAVSVTPKSKSTPTAKAATILLPSKTTKVKPSPTPSLAKKKPPPTPTPTPANTKKEKKKKGGVGGFFKGVLGGSGKEKKAEPTPKPKKADSTQKPKKY